MLAVAMREMFLFIRFISEIHHIILELFSYLLFTKLFQHTYSTCPYI